MSDIFNIPLWEINWCYIPHGPRLVTIPRYNHDRGQDSAAEQHNV